MTVDQKPFKLDSSDSASPEFERSLMQQQMVEHLATAFDDVYDYGNSLSQLIKTVFSGSPDTWTPAVRHLADRLQIPQLADSTTILTMLLPADQKRQVQAKLGSCMQLYFAEIGSDDLSVHNGTGFIYGRQVKEFNKLAQMLINREIDLPTAYRLLDECCGTSLAAFRNEEASGAILELIRSYGDPQDAQLARIEADPGKFLLLANLKGVDNAMGSADAVMSEATHPVMRKMYTCLREVYSRRYGEVSAHIDNPSAPFERSITSGRDTILVQQLYWMFSMYVAQVDPELIPVIEENFQTLDQYYDAYGYLARLINDNGLALTALHRDRVTGFLKGLNPHVSLLQNIDSLINPDLGNMRLLIGKYLKNPLDLSNAETEAVEWLRAVAMWRSDIKGGDFNVTLFAGCGIYAADEPLGEERVAQLNANWQDARTAYEHYGKIVSEILHSADESLNTLLTPPLLFSMWMLEWVYGKFGNFDAAIKELHGFFDTQDVPGVVRLARAYSF